MPDTLPTVHPPHSLLTTHTHTYTLATHVAKSLPNGESLRERLAPEPGSTSSCMSLSPVQPYPTSSLSSLAPSSRQPSWCSTPTPTPFCPAEATQPCHHLSPGPPPTPERTAPAHSGSLRAGAAGRRVRTRSQPAGLGWRLGPGLCASVSTERPAGVCGGDGYLCLQISLSIPPRTAGPG